MFRVFRQAARRAASKSNEAIPASIANSSMVAVAAMLIAMASEKQKENSVAAPADHSNPNSKRLDKSFSLLPTIPRSTCQCELSAQPIPPALKLRRNMTSQLMAAEATAKTFFSLYEVDFDHPLGSGAYGDVYLCRERSSGEECALKKIPKVRAFLCCCCS